MLKLCLVREHFTEKSTEGSLFLGGAFVCHTLEDKTRDGDIFETKITGLTAIPYGKYRVTVEHSPKFGPDTLTVNGVPNFKHVRIHAGNKPEDTEGCILVGLVNVRPDDHMIGQSRAALAVLKDHTVPHMKKGMDCWLHIVDARMIPWGYVPKRRNDDA